MSGPHTSAQPASDEVDPRLIIEAELVRVFRLQALLREEHAALLAADVAAIKMVQKRKGALAEECQAAVGRVRAAVQRGNRPMLHGLRERFFAATEDASELARQNAELFTRQRGVIERRQLAIDGGAAEAVPDTGRRGFAVTTLGLPPLPPDPASARS